MRCQQAEDYIGRELDAVLVPEAIGKLREHLDVCENCQQFRADLLVGQRLLAATEPQLPDNFEWKLQLKLSQVLNQVAAEQYYPWHTETHDRWGWVRNFGAATAVGLAAVLALAMLVGPFGLTGGTPSSGVKPGAPSQIAASSSDRRPLLQPRSRGPVGFGVQHVGTAGNVRGVGQRRWSNSLSEEQLTIWRLRAENQQLHQVLLESQRLNALMKARLDTSGSETLHLQQ